MEGGGGDERKTDMKRQANREREREESIVMKR